MAITPKNTSWSQQVSDSLEHNKLLGMKMMTDSNEPFNILSLHNTSNVIKDKVNKEFVAKKQDIL